MRNRYAEVALTYTRPWGVRAMGAAVAGAMTLLLWRLGHPRDFNRSQIFDIGQIFLAVMVGVGWAGAVAEHAKSQLGHWRTALTPDFRAPHIAVAAVAVGIVIALLACFTFNGHDERAIPRVGLAGVTLLAAAAFSNITPLHGMRYPALLFAAVMSFALRPVQDGLLILIGGSIPSLSWSVLGIALVAWALLFRRMARMYLELDGDGLSAMPNWKLRASITGDRANTGLYGGNAGRAEEFLRGTDRLNRTDHIFSATFFRRVEHWRIAIGTGRMKWLTAGLMLIIFSAIAYFQPRRVTHTGIFGWGLFAMALTPMYTIETWIRRWLTLSQEALLPMTRRRMFVEQWTAMALDLALMWFAMSIVLILPSLFYARASLTSKELWFLILFLGAGQAPLFCLNLLVLRWRSAVLSTIAFVVILFGQVGLPVAGIALLNAARPTALLAGAAALLAMGGMGFVLAYRLWLVTDLD
jgi:hypothetical protein